MPRCFRVVSGPLVGQWIEAELASGFGTVGAVVPRCYSAYARILHPVESLDGRRSSWEDVGKLTGKVVHSRVQWHSLVGASDPDDLSVTLRTVGQPRRGELPVDLFTELIGVLTSEGSENASLYYLAYWTGWAWAAGFKPLSRGGLKRTGDGCRSPNDAEGLIRGDLSLPLLRIKGNDYRVLSGTAESVNSLKQQDHDCLPGPHAPTMAWPHDRSWFLVTDIDFDSTLIGGSQAAMTTLSSWGGLTILPIELDYSLSADGDRENL